MDFNGFESSDFEFFKRKKTMEKSEYEKKKEGLKRLFRGLCYQLQKCYHKNTDGVLILEKDFQGLNKGKDHLYARANINGIDFLGLEIDLYQEGLNINLISPADGDYLKFELFKNALKDKKDIFARLFRENKSIYMTIYKRDIKKPRTGCWTEEFKFENKELNINNLDLVVNNIEKIQPYPFDNKNIGGVKIKLNIPRPEAIKQGKALPNKVCTEVIKMFNFCELIGGNE